VQVYIEYVCLMFASCLLHRVNGVSVVKQSIITLSYALASVEHELTRMSFNSRVNSFIVSCEFELIYVRV